VGSLILGVVIQSFRWYLSGKKTLEPSQEEQVELMTTYCFEKVLEGDLKCHLGKQTKLHYGVFPGFAVWKWFHRLSNRMIERNVMLFQNSKCFSVRTLSKIIHGG
jgi:hypothetical protein